jgi:phosphoribosyl-dephospho-CoA transferase
MQAQILWREVMERMVIQVTAEQKRTISAKAKAEKVTEGEMVRRAVESYSQQDEAALNQLLDTVKATTGEAIKAIDAAERELKRTRAHFEAKKPLRKVA